MPTNPEDGREDKDRKLTSKDKESNYQMRQYKQTDSEKAKNGRHTNQVKNKTKHQNSKKAKEKLFKRTFETMTHVARILRS